MKPLGRCVFIIRQRDAGPGRNYKSVNTRSHKSHSSVRKRRHVGVMRGTLCQTKKLQEHGSTPLFSSIKAVKHESSFFVWTV